MPRSPLEDLAIDALLDPAALAPAEPSLASPGELPRNALGLHLGELRSAPAEAAPFRSSSIDGRLAEIDEALAAEAAPPALRRNRATRSQPRAAGSASLPTMDSTAVHPAVRALPGGHAFALLLPAPSGERPGDAVARNSGLARALPPPREIYLRVREFLRELRTALFGFQRELLRTPELRAQLKMQLGSDVELSLAGPAPSAAVSAQLAAGIVRAADSMRDALALFAKVVEIVASLVKAALHPVHAVRAIYQALRRLYELLVAHLEARG